MRKHYRESRSSFIPAGEAKVAIRARAKHN